MLDCQMKTKEVLLSICSIFGYLTPKYIKKLIKDKIKDEELYGTFITISRRLRNSEAKDKKIEILLQPIMHETAKSLKTKEITFNQKHLNSKTSMKTTQEMIIEDDFIVDGVQGLSTNDVKFCLMNDEDTFLVELTKEQSHLKEQLLASLQKYVYAKILVEKVNDKIVKQTIVEMD
jgi:hypothetical protein